MVHYPDCPYCGNQALSVVDVKIDGIQLKGLQCNNPECNKYFGFFKDYDNEIEEIKKEIIDLDNRVDDLER